MDRPELTTAELEAVERDAFADFWAAAPADLRARYGIAHRPVGDGVLLRASGIGGSMVFNRLLGYGITGAAQAETLDSVIAEFGRAGIESWVIQVAPAAPGLAALAAGARAGAAPAGVGQVRARAGTPRGALGAGDPAGRVGRRGRLRRELLRGVRFRRRSRPLDRRPAGAGPLALLHRLGRRGAGRRRRPFPRPGARLARLRWHPPRPPRPGRAGRAVRRAHRRGPRCRLPRLRHRDRRAAARRAGAVLQQHPPCRLSRGLPSPQPAPAAARRRSAAAPRRAEPLSV